MKGLEKAEKVGTFVDIKLDKNNVKRILTKTDQMLMSPMSARYVASELALAAEMIEKEDGLFAAYPATEEQLREFSKTDAAYKLSEEQIQHALKMKHSIDHIKWAMFH